MTDNTEILSIEMAEYMYAYNVQYYIILHITYTYIIMCLELYVFLQSFSLKVGHKINAYN